MTILTATQARTNLYKLIDSVHINHKPAIIKGKRNNVVMVDEEDWNSIQETLYLSSIPGMIESIKEGLNTPIEECVPYVFD